MYALREFARLAKVGFARFAPEHIRIRRVRNRARSRQLGTILDAVISLGGSLAGEKALVNRINITANEIRVFRVGSRDDNRRYAEDIGGETRGDELGNKFVRTNENLATHVPAFFQRGELIFEVNRGRTRFDHCFGQFKSIERATEPGFAIGDYRREPINVVLAFHVLNLIGADERVINAANQFGRGIHGIETLIGVHLSRRVRVPRDLPAAHVNGFQSRLRLLNGLVSGQRAERVNKWFGPKQTP